MGKSVWMGVAVAGLAIFALNCAPRPTEKEMLGKVRGKASLRLSDGSTISQDGSDEYRPYLIRLSDGYLVLVFGSNRSGLHNIYMTKSIEPFNGFEIPFFSPPVMVTDNRSAIDDTSEINFAAVANGTSVDLYVNLHTASSFIRKGTITNPNSPDISPALAAITNTGQQDHTIIGVSDDGTNLITTDFSGVAYVINPNQSITGNAYGFGLDYATSATQVRQDNTGYQDSVIGTYYGSTVATTGDFPFGPIIDLDISLLEAGLFITHINTLYAANAADDVIIFSANDGFSDDMYVVTSHTAAMLWETVGGFGFDTVIPPAPTPDHLYTFDSACGTDDGIGGLTGTCSAITPTGTSYDGTNYGPFNGTSSNILLDTPTPNLGSAFTIAAWINVPTTTCGSACTIAANSATGIDTNGFRFYIDATAQNVVFEIGNGNVSEGISAAATSSFTIGAGWHHVAVTVNTFGGALVYVDGAALGFTMAPMPSAPLTTGNITIGSLLGGGAYFGGNMDNVAIFQYELDPMSVFALYLE